MTRVARAAGASPILRTGRIVATYGRHATVEDDSGARVRCHPRGKRLDAVVGDWVNWSPVGDEGVIERVHERRNVLYRQDAERTKTLAANIDQVLVLLAAEPVFSEAQLARALIAARAAGVPALIALNKRDVQPAFDAAWARLAPYRAMGEVVLPLQLCGAHDDTGLSALLTRLHDCATLVMGPSGTGKSTLINRLLPEAQALTQTISHALGTGRHTTTHSTWYWLDGNRRSALIDSPGFHEFGLHHLQPEQLAALMPDLQPFLGQCRFHNCTHRQEPGCAVRAAVAPDGPITPGRWQLYVALYEELRAARRF